MKERINISVDGELLKQIDEYAKKLGQSRSAFVCMTAAAYIQQQNMLSNLPQLVQMYQKEFNEENA